ncbi:MAG: hypothetical protein HRU38_24330, partial [Saccharospirillaceae bacterium]|nr:hypothetical protein [Pseudomonadales bacterium]NRB81749.1 hypothetical protein [Saccharospirillaceae bacterium]
EINVTLTIGQSSLLITQLDNWGLLELYAVDEFPIPVVPVEKVEKQTRMESFDQAQADADNAGFVYLDLQGGNNELINRFVQGWAFGAYSSGDNITQMDEYTGIVQFQNGAKAGSYLYTQFDQNSVINTGANQSDFNIDLSDPQAAVRLNINQTPLQNWQLLIKDTSTWWASENIELAQQDWDSTSQQDINLHNLTWYPVDNNDINQVDIGGEMQLIASAQIDIFPAPQPDFSDITGLGFMAAEDSNEAFTLGAIGLVNAYFYPKDYQPIIDSDGDGISDDYDDFPNDPNEIIDSDGDGVGDQSDRFPLDENESTDFDDDLIGDEADLDDDNDGVLDLVDDYPFDANRSSFSETQTSTSENTQTNTSDLTDTGTGTSTIDDTQTNTSTLNETGTQTNTSSVTETQTNTTGNTQTNTSSVTDTTTQTNTTDGTQMNTSEGTDTQTNTTDNTQSGPGENDPNNQNGQSTTGNSTKKSGSIQWGFLLLFSLSLFRRNKN